MEKGQPPRSAENLCRRSRDLPATLRARRSARESEIHDETRRQEDLPARATTHLTAERHDHLNVARCGRWVPWERAGQSATSHQTAATNRPPPSSTESAGRNRNSTTPSSTCASTRTRASQGLGRLHPRPHPQPPEPGVIPGAEKHSRTQQRETLGPYELGDGVLDPLPCGVLGVAAHDGCDVMQVLHLRGRLTRTDRVAGERQVGRVDPAHRDRTVHPSRAPTRVGRVRDPTVAGEEAADPAARR